MDDKAQTRRDIQAEMDKRSRHSIPVPRYAAVAITVEDVRPKLGCKRNAEPKNVTDRLKLIEGGVAARIVSNTKDGGHTVFVPSTASHAAYGGNVLRDREQAIDRLPDCDIIGHVASKDDAVGKINQWAETVIVERRASTIMYQPDYTRQIANALPNRMR